MTPEEREKITDLRKCNFKDFDVYYKLKSEERKAMTKEEKLVKLISLFIPFFALRHRIKEEEEALTEKYGFCIIDGHRQKIGNFKIEPPGLFRGRGEHPKMGMLKRRVEAEDIVINIGKYVEKDFQKYENVRKLKEHVDLIRREYTQDFRDKSMRKRQRAVALYFIYKVSLRLGSEFYVEF
ncbi:unnamed protein product [Larinioides sclopetarius]|uniref:DNA topoisomerase 1 n=1 Tax=Larinioides sclopetarius TaxID=280406 RepID=A0AAV1ZUF9_9ARAC